MKILFKTALIETQYKNREIIKGANGYEIHLSDFKINEEMLIEIKNTHKTIVIHAPLKDSIEDISHLLTNFNDEGWKKLLKLGHEMNVNLVLHNDLTLESKLFESENYKKLVEFLRGSTNKIHLENSSYSNYKNKGKSEEYREVFESIIPICHKVNKDVGREAFVPLFDTCHYLIEMNIPNYTPLAIEQRIDDTIKNNGAIHLSYAQGNGMGKNHGESFSTHPQMLERIIKQILISEKKYGNETLVTLELNEDEIDIPLNLYDTFCRVTQIIKRNT